MTRSLKLLPVGEIREKFAKALGISKRKTSVQVGMAKEFELSIKAEVAHLDVQALSSLVDLIHEYHLDASTVYREEYNVAVLLRKKVAICHPEDADL